MPIGLPNTSPSTTPSRTPWPPPSRLALPRATPALASANSGMIANATQPCSACCSRSTGDTASCRAKLRSDNRDISRLPSCARLAVLTASTATAGALDEMFGTKPGAHRRQQADHDARDRRVNPGRVRARPRHQRRRDVGPRRSHTQLLHDQDDGDAQRRDGQPGEAEARRVEDGDDDDRAESSMTASASSRMRSAGGTRLPSSARTPTANAMSVAIGTPQPPDAGVPAFSSE